MLRNDLVRGAGMALLLVLAPSVTAQEGALGRLFLTPQERSDIDRIRRGEPVVAQSVPSTALTGYVKRSDGRNTVWLSGIPHDSEARQANQLVPSQVQGGVETEPAVATDNPPPAARRPARRPAAARTARP